MYNFRLKLDNAGIGSKYSLAWNPYWDSMQGVVGFFLFSITTDRACVGFDFGLLSVDRRA
jgi:hypothetical protein